MSGQFRVAVVFIEVSLVGGGGARYLSRGFVFFSCLGLLVLGKIDTEWELLLVGF